MFQITLLDDFVQDRLDFRELAWLGDVIEGAQANGVDGGLHAGMARHDDGFGIRRDLLELLKDLDAGHSGHAQVENGGIESGLFQGLQGRFAVRANGDLMTQAGQLGAHEFLQRLFIIGKQDAQAIMRRGQAFPP